MRHGLRRSWRAVRTGFAFAAFGLGAVVIGGLVFPVLAAISVNRRADLRVQRTIHRAFRIFVRGAMWLGLFRVTRRGLEQLAAPGGRVIVANHPTLLDVVLLVSLLPQADCVVKKAAWTNRYLRRVVQAAGYIPNEAGPEMLAECLDRLRAGRSLLLFPEGTRSPEGTGLGPFHRGAARLSLASGCDIVPVVIRCDPPTLRKGEPWFVVPERMFHITLDVETPLSPTAYLRDSDGRASRRLTEDLRHLFERRLCHVSP